MTNLPGKQRETSSIGAELDKKPKKHNLKGLIGKIFMAISTAAKSKRIYGGRYNTKRWQKEHLRGISREKYKGKPDYKSNHKLQL